MQYPLVFGVSGGACAGCAVGGYCGLGYTGRVLYRVPTHLPAVSLHLHPHLQPPLVPALTVGRWGSRARRGNGRWGVKVAAGGRHSPTTGPSPITWPIYPIKARFRVLYPKVSLKSRVSPVFVDEACHTPCFKKPLRKHDLEFPRFPYLPAFSHKE